MEKKNDWINQILPDLSEVETGRVLSQNAISHSNRTLSNEEFVLKTKQQIQKDFAKFNLEFRENFIFDLWTKEEIELAIQENLAIIIKFGETKLMQLLYTIDIPEEQFLRLTQEQNFLPLLAETILKREALKVFFRSKFNFFLPSLRRDRGR